MILLALAMILIAGCASSNQAELAGLEKADIVVVTKKSYRLELLRDGKLLQTYSVVFGADPVGHKQHEGDERTPEGRYLIDEKRDVGETKYYKALHVSYPNSQDLQRALARGGKPGGLIFIHGQRNGFGWAFFFMQFFNWTDGCIALSNQEMDQVFSAVKLGTPIVIKP